MAEISAPTSMEEVELLVQCLYKPSTPQSIAQVDEQLKRLQHSPEGWQLADTLLGSHDDHVRFFAALTFQIKLNNDGSNLDPATAQSVLMRLIHWTVHLDRAGEGQMVRKKLAAVFGTYFLRSPVSWHRPLLHLAASFVQGDAITSEQIPRAHDALTQLLPLLAESQLVTLLLVAAQLATDGAKVDSSNAESARIHDQMELLVVEASIVMHYAVAPPGASSPGSAKAQCLTCFLNWVNYAQPMWHSKQEVLAHLRCLVPGLASLLTDKDEFYRNEAMDVFRDILESYTTFFQPSHMQTIARLICKDVRPLLLRALKDQDPSGMTIAQLVIAYGIANIQQIVEQPENEVAAQIPLSLIFAILQAPGYPGDDDETSIHTIEFWNTYIEYVNEATYSSAAIETPQHWVSAAKTTCMAVLNLLWQKMRTPDAETAKQWSEEELEGFKEFRMDASDLILSMYVFLGTEMLQHLVTLALTSLETRTWQDLEAALFCINVLADNVLEDQTAEHIILHIFRSPLYRIVGDFSQAMPTQARRIAVDTLGAYGGCIERHAEFLPDTLRFLFASLENPGLYISAAKSIAELCKTCRSSLTGELDGFLAQYNRFTQGATSEPYTNEKVIGAIAAIIQAVSPESAKAQPLSALLDIIEGMLAYAVQYTDPVAVDAKRIEAIECLAAIGKNLQTDCDTPIDLYDENPPRQDQGNHWCTAEGQAIQRRILDSCQKALQLLGYASSGVVDGVCRTLRAGFTETKPGPFVFPPGMIISFMEQCSASTNNLESVLSMIAVLVVQHSRKDQPRIDAEVQRVYQKVVIFLSEIGEPARDPEVAQGCIDVVNSMNPRYLNILLDTAGSGDMVRPILDFALKALDGQDLMPKRSAAEFWAGVVKPSTAPTDENVCSRLEQIKIAYGPPLVQTLMNQIAGRGQRSELNQLCEPLRAAIQTLPQAKGWISAALDSPELPVISETVGPGEKQRFAAAVTAVRGDTRKTRELVKNFYAACRGTVPSYG